ncbi:MAG: Gfo/Idh/MocA family oxidoreductase [Spirochaetaceae bacterium]|nr:Gfo/Idh/MocA family oxidoreductase [Spirochaetaceae bacterium]
MKKIRIAAIGCGNRTLVYLSLLMKHYAGKFEITALADPVEERRILIASFQDGGNIRHFEHADEFLKEERMADVVIIATQDDFHFEPSMKAMEKGYDLILEKPISNRLDETFALEKKAKEQKRKVLVCHVLRYTPFYNKIKELVDGGAVGKVISFNATEGVGTWHFSHSFIRGNWGNTKKSSPMILAKSCHDMDVFSWLVDEKCISISSFGELTYFRKENMPQGAPFRCADGCPVSGKCQYNALNYMDSRRDPWLAQLLDSEKNRDRTGGASDDEVLEFLKNTSYGKCVYQSDNDAVDHQVVNMKFNKDVTGTFTMTPFDTGRSITIFGSKGVLRGGEYLKSLSGHDFVISDHENNALHYQDIVIDDGGYEGHGGGDIGFIRTWYEQLSTNNPEELKSSIHKSLESHVMAWAAEESRLTGKTIEMDEFACQFET